MHNTHCARPSLNACFEVCINFWTLSSPKPFNCFGSHVRCVWQGRKCVLGINFDPWQPIFVPKLLQNCPPGPPEGLEKRSRRAPVTLRNASRRPVPRRTRPQGGIVALVDARALFLKNHFFSKNCEEKHTDAQEVPNEV